MTKRPEATAGIRTRNHISSDIAASLAGIPTGESINREAFTKTPSAEKHPAKHPRLATASMRSQNPSRFVRAHRHCAVHPTGVTRSYQELTRKLQRRRQAQRMMGATVVFGLAATLLSIIF